MNKLFTHFNVDLDAVASVWAWKAFVNAEVTPEFKPANWDGAEMDETDVAVDLNCGLKGDKDEDGTVHACFKSIVETHASADDREALKFLVDFVDAQDAHGNAVMHLLGVDELKAHSFIGINVVLRAFQAKFPRNDALVCEKMGEIFDGLLEMGRSRLRAAQEVAEAEWVNGKVAIVRDSKERSTNGQLMKQGAMAIVYVNGNDLGVVRRNDISLRMDHEKIKAVVGNEDGWFFHTSGFMAARGSFKAPAESKSQVDPLALAQVVAELL